MSHPSGVGYEAQKLDVRTTEMAFRALENNPMTMEPLED